MELKLPSPKVCVTRFVETGPVVLANKIFKFSQYILDCFYLFFFFGGGVYFVIVSCWKRTALYLNKLNFKHLHLRELIKLTHRFWKTFFFNILNVFSLLKKKKKGHDPSFIWIHFIQVCFVSSQDYNDPCSGSEEDFYINFVNDIISPWNCFVSG